MKQGLSLLLIVIFMLALTGCKSEQTVKQAAPGNPTHNSLISRSELEQILAKEPQSHKKLPGKLISGVIPHHLLAASILTAYMAALAEQNPELIILVGPNHDNEGSRIITGYYDWLTPEGRVMTNQQVVQSLVQNGLAAEDEAVMETEHSVAGLMPLIKHYMPKARVVGIILHHDVSLAEVNRILDGMAPYMNENTVLLASVDFSHYLTRQQAQEKDQLMREYLMNFDYTTLFSLNSDYLDSPAALAFALRRAEGQGIKGIQILDNSNSGLILNNDTIPTTSYFSLALCQPGRS